MWPLKWQLLNGTFIVLHSLCALGMKPHNFVAQYKRIEMQWFGFELIYLNICLHTWKRTSAPKQLSWTWQHLNDFVQSIGWLTPTAESSTFRFELLQTMQLKCFFLQAGFPCLIRDFHKNKRDWWYSRCFKAAITKDVGSRLKAKLNYTNLFSSKLQQIGNSLM